MEVMGRDSWDAVLASSPLNATASRVTSKGYQYSPAVKPSGEKEWDAPPKTLPLPKGADFVDLTGHVQGRLKVAGYIGSQNGARWLCRCACGRYVQRKTKSLLNPDNSEDRCRQCRHAAYLAREATSKRKAERKALGCERLFQGSTTPPRDDLA